MPEKKPRTDKDRLRSLVQKNVAVLDHEGSAAEPALLEQIEDSRVRAALKRNRSYGDLPLDVVRPDPDQVRRVDTGSEAFDELVSSVKEHGVLEPILVRWRPEEQLFQIISGERRYQAAKRAKLTTIPAVLKDVDDTTKAVHQLVENLQREDLNPIEEARAFQRFLTASGQTQDELARKIGKSKSYVSNTLGLLEKFTRKEQDDLSAVLPAKLPGKYLIFEAARTDDPEIRRSILRGELSRAEAREAVRTQKPRGKAGRRRHVSRRFDLDTPEATVTVTFQKPEASEKEILTALRSAVREQEKLAGKRRNA